MSICTHSREQLSFAISPGFAVSQVVFKRGNSCPSAAAIDVSGRPQRGPLTPILAGSQTCDPDRGSILSVHACIIMALPHDVVQRVWFMFFWLMSRLAKTTLHPRSLVSNVCRLTTLTCSATSAVFTRGKKHHPQRHPPRRRRWSHGRQAMSILDIAWPWRGKPGRVDVVDT